MASLLREGKDVCFTPTGFSMRPFIEGGRDSVVLRRRNDVRVGDIVLAGIPEIASADIPETASADVRGSKPQQTKPMYVLHRVIGVDGERVTLMGDGNITGTEECSKADVIGTVVRIENRCGRRKPLTRGRLWFRLLGQRRILLKIYRKLGRLG